MLNDLSGGEIPGESSAAQTLDKLVYLSLKAQTVSYKRYKKTVIKQSVAPATFGTA